MGLFPKWEPSYSSSLLFAFLGFLGSYKLSWALGSLCEKNVGLLMLRMTILKHGFLQKKLINLRDAEMVFLSFPSYGVVISFSLQSHGLFGMTELGVRSSGATGEWYRNAAVLILTYWHDWTECSITWCNWGMLWKWCSVDSNILAWLNLVFDHLVWLGNVVEMLCIWFSCVGMIEQTVQSPGVTGECCGNDAVFILTYWHDWT